MTKEELQSLYWLLSQKKLYLHEFATMVEMEVKFRREYKFTTEGKQALLEKVKSKLENL